MTLQLTETQHAGALARLMRTATARAALFGDRPDLTTVVEQGALRAHLMSRSTADLELSALRSLLSGEGGLIEGKLTPSPGVELEPPMSEPDLQECRRTVNRPHHELAQLGQEILERDMRRAAVLGLTHPEGMLPAILAGITRPQTEPSRPRQKVISERDVLVLNIELQEDAARKRGFNYGLCQSAFVMLAFYCGLTAAEIWQSELYLHDINFATKDEADRLLAYDPAEAIREGVLVPTPTLARTMGLAPRDLAPTVVHHFRTPAVLKAPSRFIFIDGMPSGGLGYISHLFGTRQDTLAGMRPESFQRDLTRKLAEIVATEPRFIRSRDMRITLGTLRHAFLGRACRSLPLSEAGALIGSSSRRTLEDMRKTNPASLDDKTAWLPKPDKALARRIREAWVVRYGDKVVAKFEQPKP